MKSIRILSDNALILCEKASAIIEIISIRKERMVTAKMNEGTGNRKKILMTLKIFCNDLCLKLLAFINKTDKISRVS